jgi:hypothetical protein
VVSYKIKFSLLRQYNPSLFRNHLRLVCGCYWRSSAPTGRALWTPGLPLCVQLNNNSIQLPLSYTQFRNKNTRFILKLQQTFRIRFPLRTNSTPSGIVHTLVQVILMYTESEADKSSSAYRACSLVSMPRLRVKHGMLGVN